MLDFAFAASRASTTATKPALFLVSAITGGLALYSYGTDEAGAPQSLTEVVHYNGSFFISTAASAAVKQTWRTSRTQYEKSNAYAITPWQDYGLVESKVLQSVRLHCEALPADWTITLSYAVDGSDSFTSAGAYATTSGTGTTYVVSTSAAVKEFRTLRLKIAMTYGGAGTPTTYPKVLGAEVRASVDSQGPRTWQMLLDCYDENSEMQGSSRTGKTKILAVETAYAADVVELLDGYYSNDPNVYSTHNVTVDEYDIDLERPGAGAVLVTLREVQ
jgi:hypothetical protein